MNSTDSFPVSEKLTLRRSQYSPPSPPMRHPLRRATPLRFRIIPVRLSYESDFLSLSVYPFDNCVLMCRDQHHASRCI
jgi:hypothetical protein